MLWALQKLEKRKTQLLMPAFMVERDGLGYVPVQIILFQEKMGLVCIRIAIEHE